MRRNDFFKYLIFGGGGSASRSELETDTLPYTFVSKSQRLKDYRIYGNTVDGESVGDLVTEGEHVGEYCVPVTITNGTDTNTTNIYLPEQIRKVGDEFEYIDYKKQKFHRVRKNLLKNNETSQTINGVTITVYDDGSIVCNGRATQTFPFAFAQTLLSPGAYILCGNNNDNSNSTTFRMQAYNLSLSLWASDEGTGATFELSTQATIITRLVIYSGFDCENLIFRPMIIQSNLANDNYEPYIENTELDVALPALPTTAGTNTLSVETEVQPSKIYVQGNISEIETVSVQALQANMRSLQPLSFDDDDLQLDVMPTDNDLQPDVMPIEKPVLNLNDVSEIENAEIERGVESAE